MTPYLALLGIASASGSLSTWVTRSSTATSSDSEKRPWNVFDVITLLILIVFSGSRVGVGTDYNLYASLFRGLDPGNWTYSVETSEQDAGFAHLQLALKTVSEEPQSLFWLCATLTILPVYSVIRRDVELPHVALWLYLCLGSYLLPLNLVRQGLAASILFYASVRFLDRKKLFFLIAVVAAGSLHASGWAVGAVLFLLRNWTVRPRIAVVLLGGSLVFASAIGSIGNLAELVQVLNPRYGEYALDQDAGVGTYLVISAKLAILAACYHARDAMDALGRRSLLYSTIGVATLIVGTQSIIFARLDLYFSLFLIIAATQAYQSSQNQGVKLAAFVGTIAYFAIYVTNYGGLLGYESTLM